jgi:NAD(P)-dependent dehydrogenase (short-subunit alcohol dehydrogenase family)
MLDQQAIDASEARERLVSELANVEKAIREGGEAHVLLRMHRELEGQWEEARDTLRGLEARRALTAGQTVQARIGRLVQALESAEGPAVDVVVVNAAMLALFQRVTVDYRHGVLDFQWQHGGTIELPFYLPGAAR